LGFLSVCFDRTRSCSRPLFSPLFVCLFVLSLVYVVVARSVEILACLIKALSGQVRQRVGTYLQVWSCDWVIIHVKDCFLQRLPYFAPWDREFLRTTDVGRMAPPPGADTESGASAA